jgi:hypothetical protein
LQNPLLHVPWQQSEFCVHPPPSGLHVVPVGLHTPFWQVPPSQQSESEVHVPLPLGMQAAAHWSAPPGPGTHTLLQHSSQSAQGVPAGKQVPPWLGKQRFTPSSVGTQLDLPPLQQFWDAPRPPHTSPSGTQFCAFTQRRTPSASAVPQEPEQHPASEMQTSS